jgi:hypothetical protein
VFDLWDRNLANNLLRNGHWHLAYNLLYLELRNRHHGFVRLDLGHFNNLLNGLHLRNGNLLDNFLCADSWEGC